MDINQIAKEVLAQIDAAEQGQGASSREVSNAEVPSKLEHSLLNADISLSKIQEECSLARRYQVAAVCVAPYYVPWAADILRGSGVKVGTAVGFPHGAISAAAKFEDVKECIKNGAEEIDVAINILAVKSGNLEDARKELEEVARIAQGKALIKAVFEHSVYSPDEKETVLKMVKSCGIGFVKIQNVLSGKGADTADVRYVKSILHNNVGVKIDGGVKTLEKAKELIGADADRIGLTATIKIAQEAEAKSF